MFFDDQVENMIPVMIAIVDHLHDLEESASHPLPLLEGAPQVVVMWIE